MPKRKGMPQTFDPLYDIFEKHLHSGEFDRRPEEDLVAAIVDEYLLFLVQQGMAPHKQADDLRQDVLLEVKDMLKIKTYGHFDVRQYNLARRRVG